MSLTMLVVRLDEALSAFVEANIGEHGAHETANDYVCDLIRREMERAEAGALHRLEMKLVQAYASPDSDYAPLTAGEVVARNRS